MRTRVAKAVIRIEEGDEGVNVLRQASGVTERYGRLLRLVPEILSWDLMARNQLVFFLHHKHELDFEVCPHYLMDGDKRQRCAGDRHNECLCRIPQASCVFRDREGRPQQPEFSPHLIAALETQFVEERSRMPISQV